MSRWARLFSMIGGPRLVATLGAVLIVLGAGEAFLVSTAGGSYTEVTIDFLLISVPGLVLLAGGYQLSTSEIHPDAYPRLVVWCLAGFGLLLGIVLLLEAHPGVTVDGPIRARLLAIGVGSVAGFVIGANEARAITRARIAEERSQELQRLQGDLQEIVEKLEASNDQLEQFAYAASHDFQEPLRMISTYLRLLEGQYGDDLDEKGREYLTFAIDGADRMHAMTESLLAYSQIDPFGRDFEPVDCNAVLENVLADLRTEIERTDAEITVGSLPTIVGNADQLELLFWHLLSNALKYSGDEPPRIEITAERGAEDWIVSVTDEGIGIDPAYSNRIFEMFKRLHSRAEYSGTGIGLALCERIVESHGGEIWVDSEADSGSTFSFTVPVERERDRDWGRDGERDHSAVHAHADSRFRSSNRETV